MHVLQVMQRKPGRGDASPPQNQMNAEATCMKL